MAPAAGQEAVCVKLIDFGLSKHMGHDEIMKQQVRKSSRYAEAAGTLKQQVRCPLLAAPPPLPKPPSG